MFNLDRYEFSAEDNAWEKLDAKLGNFLVRTEEIAEDKHIVKRAKLREKYFKAKAKADAAEAAYYAKKYSPAKSLSYENTNSRVIDI
jgi:replication fork clamp-binding protein CrfC